VYVCTPQKTNHDFDKTRQDDPTVPNVSTKRAQREHYAAVASALSLPSVITKPP